jgi:uncharacterized protein YjiS (DUF1127 family)
MHKESKMMTLEEQRPVIARAQRARSGTVSALAVSALRALWTQGLRLHRAWAAERTRAQLHALNDRTLRDIGLHRDQIDSLLR